MARFYTNAMITWLRATWPMPDMTLSMLTAQFNAQFGTSLEPPALKAALTNHRIRCGRKPGTKKGTPRVMSPEARDALEQMYQLHPLPELTILFNERFGLDLTERQIRTFIKNHGMRCPRTGQFFKGASPWNTGTKGIMKRNSGTFAKGQTPRNLKPLGHERIDSKDGYVLVKIAERNPYTGFPTRYKAKHIVIWEAAHGPVPKGHIVRFKDGDKRNFALDNLICISKGANGLLNKKYKLDQVPGKLKDTIVLVAKVEAAAAGRREKAA